MKDIKSKLQKIRALAESTSFEHEKESALKMLEKLMKKHGITEGELDDEAVSMQDFRFKDKREEALLMQIVFTVLNTMKYKASYLYHRGNKVAKKLGVECTVSQKLEIEFLFGFYRKLYQQEEKRLFSAFLHKHKLFPDIADAYTEPTAADAEELLRLAAMMHGMEDKSPQRRLTAKDGE